MHALGSASEMAPGRYETGSLGWIFHDSTNLGVCDTYGRSTGDAEGLGTAPLFLLLPLQGDGSCPTRSSTFVSLWRRLFAPARRVFVSFCSSFPRWFRRCRSTALERFQVKKLKKNN